MTAEIRALFPSSIYIAKDIIDADYNNELIEESLSMEQSIAQGGYNWRCQMYNTLGTLNLTTVPKFEQLIKTVTHHVNEYVTCMGSDYQYSCNQAWVNIGHMGSYQESHCHAGSTISAIYYMTAPEGSGHTIFESPLEPDMLPIKNITKNNPLNFQTYEFEPIVGQLLIFRSYLRHIVTMGSNDLPRITVAFNY